MLSVKVFRKCKGFEKSQFYKISKELQCGDLVLKQTFHCGAMPRVSKQCIAALNCYVAKALPVKYQITAHRPCMAYS